MTGRPSVDRRTPATTRRRVLSIAGAAVVAGASGLLGGCGRAPTLDDVVGGFTGALDPDDPYRHPDAGELATAVDALGSVAAGGADDRLDGLGLTVREVMGGTAYTVVSSDPGGERPWGLYAFPRDTRPALLVEVPHPASDLDTERVALEVLRRRPGAVLLVAGAHRRAGGSDADVAHRSRSLFHVVALALAARHRIPQVQLHGFDDDHARDIDLIPSAGAGSAGRALRRTARELEDEGFRVCRAWSERCNDLEGRTNAQGIASAAAGLDFLHLEMSRAVRSDQDRRAAVARVLARAWG